MVAQLKYLPQANSSLDPAEYQLLIDNCWPLAAERSVTAAA